MSEKYELDWPWGFHLTPVRMTEIQNITNVGEETGKGGLLYTVGKNVTYSINYGKKYEDFIKN